MKHNDEIRGIVIDDAFLFEMWYEDFILYEAHPNAFELFEEVFK